GLVQATVPAGPIREAVGPRAVRFEGLSELRHAARNRKRDMRRGLADVERALRLGVLRQRDLEMGEVHGARHVAPARLARDLRIGFAARRLVETELELLPVDTHEDLATFAIVAAH